MMNTCTRTSLGIATLLALAGAASGQVVISQVYGGGGNTSAPAAIMKHDFVELHNPTGAAVPIGGWSVQYSSATGSAWTVSQIPAGVSIIPGEYYTIRQSASTGAVPDTVADLIPTTVAAMSATGGRVALVNNTTALTASTCAVGVAGVIDVVGYGTAATCFEGTGPTATLNNNTAAIRTAGNVDTNNNNTDFVTVSPPTPRTGGGINADPAADLVLGAITESADPVVGVPSNVVFTIAGVTNNGPNAASNAKLLVTLPTGATFVSSTLTGGSVTAGVLSIPLPSIAASGGSIPAFTVTLNASQAFPVEQLLALTWTASYSNDLVPADNIVKTVTEVITTLPTGPVAKDDIAWGWSTFGANNTIKIVRNAVNGTPALVRNNFRNFNFVQGVEFDNAGGVQRNPAGNLVGVNFGAAATGGLVYLYNTTDVSAASGVLAGSFTDATTFTSGTATSLISRSRLGGASISPDNTKIAITGQDAGSLIVFDYNPAGPNYLTNGREITSISNVGSTVGTRWLDNDTVMIASAGTGTDMRFRLVDDVGGALTIVSSNLLSAPGGGNMFTDIEYLPEISPLVIVSVGRFVSPTTSNTLFVFDTSTPGWELGVPATFDYSSSINTLREISYASNGDLILTQFGGSGATVEPLTPNTPSLDKIANATTLGAFAAGNSTTYFQVTNLSDPDIGSSVNFSGVGVAAGVGGGSAGCNLADITEVGGTEEFPGNPDGQLTVDDLILFVNLFSAATGCPGTAPCNRADVTGIGGNGASPDGELTVDDLIEFVNAFSTGC